ncbi:hypothetical protein Tco_0610337 [Tanacetum coccineum]
MEGTLSFGGRLTLIKYVLGSLSVYYPSTFKAPKKVIHKLEGTSLWCNVIRSILGPTGGVLNFSSHKKALGTWSRVINLKHELTKVGINLPTVFKKNIEDGRSTSFWHDHWLGVTTLQESFPLLYRLELNKNCLVCERTITSLSNNNAIVSSISHPMFPSYHVFQATSAHPLLANLHLSNDCDVWEFTYDTSKRFSVNNMQKLISTMSSDNKSHPTRHRRHGIDLDTVRCPLCNNDIEGRFLLVAVYWNHQLKPSRYLNHGRPASHGS